MTAKKSAEQPNQENAHPDSPAPPLVSTVDELVEAAKDEKPNKKEK